MPAFLLRLFALIAGLWIVRWLISSLFRGSFRPPGRQNPTAENSLPSSRMVKDPVCGMYMDSRLAVEISTRKGPVYFCSEDCRSRYDAGVS